MGVDKYKKLLQQYNLNPTEWKIHKDSDAFLILINTKTGNIKVLRK